MDNAFGEALREYRRAAGLSQRDLAERTKLDFSYISKVENGRLPPPAADTIVQICSALQIPPEELLALTGKIPSAIQQNVSTNRTAQEFLREAQEMGLTDDEWKKMVKSLRNLKGRRR
jgi:HTH-type transcriptional regulator, competence development regulator